MRGTEFDWAAHIAAVARRLCGEPNAHLSHAPELRFGAHGSLSVRCDKGTWYDHENGVGGGTLDLIRHKLGVSNGAAVDWLKSELKIEMPEPRTLSAPVARLGRLIASYDYHDESGNPLFQVRRYGEGEDKTFRQFHREGESWLPGVKGVRPVPYHLPHMCAAPSRAIFIAEGEKDVDALMTLGLLATCNAGGAGKWRSEFTQYFRGRFVVVLPDNDDPGRAHADMVVRGLHAVANDIRVVELPGLPPKGDVSDWIAAGGTREALLALVKAAESVREMPAAGPHNIVPFRANKAADRVSDDEDDPPESGNYVQNDIGNALVLIDHHGRDLRYILGNGWHIWDGKRFALDPEGVLTQKRAHDIPAILIERAREEPDKKLRLKRLKWAISCGNGGRISAMVTQAKSYLFCEFEDIDKDPFLLNCQNGTIDLRTGDLRPHDRNDLISKICKVDYNPRATCPLWEKFLLEIFDGDDKMVLFLRRAIGYSITGLTKEQVVFIMHGSGSNGKSVLLETIAAVLGDYQEASASDTWISKPTGSPSNDVAGLAGARFVSVIETEHDKQLAEALVKQATGGDRMKVRFMYREFFDFMPKFKLWFATNHKPRIRGSDFAIWRRIMLLPFLVKFVDAAKVGSGQKAKDPDLKDKLIAEHAGILAWMIKGCREWQRDGLNPPTAVIAATEDYQDSQDSVSAFIRDNCWLGHGLSCAAGLLYSGYQVWCAENDEEPIATNAFARNLDDRGLPPVKRTKAARMRYGVDLKEEIKTHASEKQAAKKVTGDG